MLENKIKIKQITMNSHNSQVIISFNYKLKSINFLKKKYF